MTDACRCALIVLCLLLPAAEVRSDDAVAKSTDANPADSSDRRLSDFRNDDGTQPDGRDGMRDDTTALRKALAAGPGIVRIGAGRYRFSEVAVPEHVTLIGAGKATIIRTIGAVPVFLQNGNAHWCIRDLQIEGEAEGLWKTRKDEGRSGIVVRGCWGYEISGVTLRNFNGAALQIESSNLRDSEFGDAGTFDRITCCDNWVGIRFDKRAEYISATRLSCMRNHVGCVVHGGNMKISESNFGGNIDGVLIQDKENGSHGTLTNCLCNHNERYALYVSGVGNGMIVNGCCFFYGTMLIESSSGVNVTDGIISCHVKTIGEEANRIAGNLITPINWTFSFSAATIVKDNFLKEGNWELNRP